MAWQYNSYNDSSDKNDLIYDLRQTYAQLLDEILKRIALARIEKDFVGWFNALDDLHTEISQKLSEKEKKEYESQLAGCIEILNKYPAAYNKQDNSKENSFAVKFALKNLELWLKEKMEKHKMFGAKEEVQL